MKKQTFKILPTLLSVMLVTGCNGVNHASSDDYSDIPNSSSIPSEQGDLDKIIAEFVDGLNVNIPSVNEYQMFYEIYYYYAYSQYIISALTLDDGTIENAFNNKCANEDSLVSLNDDLYYTVEDYGYMYGDNEYEPNMTLSFYTEEGYFNFMLTRSDGAGSLDVSDIDTNWYVDYINFDGFVLGEEFPSRDINISLDTDVNIPAPSASAFPYFFEKEYEDDEGYYAATYYVILEGDQIENYLTLLKSNGYETKLETKTGQTINWDTFEIEEYTYYTGIAYDQNYQLYITIELDQNDNTLIMFNNFNDVVVKDKTSRTDWTNEEKELMNATLHQVLPFMAFGTDYELFDDSDSDWGVLVLIDTYYEDLSAEYISLLKEVGFKEDSVTYAGYTCYVYDNGEAYIEIFIDYDNGNYLEIYFEDSKLPPVTAINLDHTSLDIVAGASYQLNVLFTPKDSKRAITWSSNNENIATVSDNGLVTIKEDAVINSSAVITAQVGNLVASCTFNVKDNVVTGIEYTKDNYNVIPGGEAIKPEYILYPIGVTTNQKVSYAINPTNLNINYNDSGLLSATNEAVIGSTATISVIYNADILATATVTVVSSSVRHTLNQEFFGLKQGNSDYATYTKDTIEGAKYEAQCAASHGVQIRSKNNNSGIIGSFEGRSCASITFTFDANTFDERTVDIYASNSPFSIADMYGSSVTKVGSVSYAQGVTTTVTYEFTSDYSYIGFRSNSGAIYFTSIEIIWK